MSVYKRYFRFTQGSMVDEINRLQDLLAIAAVEADKIAKKVGGAFQTWQSTGSFAGFTFKETPCQKTYRLMKKQGLWVPRKNTPEGKAIWEDINQVPLPESVNSALRLVGLSHNFPELHHDGKWYSSGLWGFGRPISIWYVSVPWMDVDPDKLATYKAERAAGGKYNDNFEHLLWAAPEGWAELKEWQISKECEEINSKEEAKS